MNRDRILNVEIEKNYFVDPLLSTIYKYFPIGVADQYRSTYAGYQEFLQIANDYGDTDAINDVNVTFKRLLSMVKHEFETSFLKSGTAGIFPNRSFMLVLHNTDIDGVKMATYLKFRLSLLHKSYTLFYEDTFMTRRHNQPFMSTVISTQNMVADKGGLQFLRVKEMVNTIYPEHDFIAPSFLFNTKIGDGIPFGLDEDKELYSKYPIYDYLYSDEYVNLHTPYSVQSHAFSVLI